MAKKRRPKTTIKSWGKSSRSILPAIVIVLTVPSLLLNAYFISRAKQEIKPDIAGDKVKVAKVIDGDTFEIANNQRIRLRSVDAPEMGLCFSEEAKEFLANLIEGKEVVLAEGVTGQQNRRLMLVYLDDKLVNLEVIKDGYGRYHHDSSSQNETMKQAGEKAKENKLGVYNPECYGKTPDNPECVIKGNIDKNKYTDNKKYYFPGCVQYEFTIVEKDLGENWFCTEKQAQEAGFVKAASCPDSF